MANRNQKKWAQGFTVGKPTHRRQEKTPEQLKAQREMRNRIADIDERKFLRSMGVGYE